MIRNCMAMPIVTAFVMLAAGCTKEGMPHSQPNQARTLDSVRATNLGIFFVEEWVQAATPSIIKREYAIGFSIGSKGYMGGGEGIIPREIRDEPVTLSDFWQYDPATNTWTQMANLPIPLERAATFVIGAQGYVGTGYGFNTTTYFLYNTLYQYDQASNTWTQKASLPADARCDATGTSINNEGYIGTGNNLTGPFYKDWWQYDPPTDHWTQKANLPGTWGRAEATSFSIGQFGFITCGSIYVTNGTANDLWSYNPAFDFWSQEANLPASGRIYPTGFNYGSYGAVTCGEGVGGYLNDFWYYDMNANTWHSSINMGGGARDKAVGFAINGIPYVGTGEVGPGYNNASDFWYLTYVLL